jgi:methylated-DNA-[protein]-cysteine S-methyltransferase
MTLSLFVDRFESPLGEFELLADEAGNLLAAGWVERQDRLRFLLARQYPSTEFQIEDRHNPSGVTSAVEAYFDGDLEGVQSLPVSTGGTPFQKNVWQSLRLIPPGETISYGSLANKIGNPDAVRAVGLANGANPICIVLPCHRVIGTNGSLTGYGGGLERKKWLLEHERKHRKGGSGLLFD